MSNAMLIRGIVATLLAAVLYSCANMARPGGGPYDMDPPVYVKSTPLPNELNFKKNKIEILFDEVVQIEKPTEKIVVSPAQKEQPKIQANGKKITVELLDSLLPNTTYTLDFTDAVVDNNERNVLNNFSLSFSTGPAIDTMQVSGYVLNAENLEPITGMLVGLQRINPDSVVVGVDSSFMKRPLERLSVTDARGRFNIKNVAPGSYRIYALKDIDRNYRFNRTEDMAFDESVITPYMEMKWHADSLWLDSLTVDTVIMEFLPHYYPDDIVLRSFNENLESQYLERSARMDENKFSLYFAAPADSMPVVRPLSFDETLDWGIVEKSARFDTLTYWFKDTTIMKIDTMQFELTYLRLDSNYRQTPFVDTVRMIYRRPKVSGEKKEEKKRRKRDEEQEEEKPAIQFMKVKSSVAQAINLYSPIVFEFDQPLDTIDMSKVSLVVMEDSVWTPTEFTFEQDSLHIRNYVMKAKWRSGASYKVRIDSAAVVSIYGKHNDKLESSFKGRAVEEYANMIVDVSGLDGPAYIELLNGSDVPVRKAVVRNSSAKLFYLEPGNYYMRLVVDRNENGRFDPGNYLEKRQPEEVYYFPGELSLRANWDVTQSWDLKELPLYRQKPKAITKNKPVEKVNKNANNNNQNVTGSSSMGGFPNASSFGF